MNINYEGLVCYLNSNKDSKQNNVWLDSSGNNNNATLTSFSDDDFNGSYVQFNGNNYAVIPRCIQDDFTLSAEVILESSTSTTGPWQQWYNYASLIDAETSGVQNDFGLTISKDGHAYFGIGNPDRTIPYAQKSLFNEKHIITCTRKKDTGEYVMYIDGILIKKEIHPNKNSLTYPSEIYVGKGKNNRFLSMKLFSIRIYNRVLDNFEIKQDSFFVKNKVYVNENNLPIIVDKLMDASNIKIANNKYGNRVQTVIDKIVEKADNVTKAINQEVINTDYSFKVGTGTNVDVSSDVQDGFGEVGLKGVTYQNLFNHPKYVDHGTYNPATNEFINTADEWFTIAKTELLKSNTTYTMLFWYKSTADKIGVRADYSTVINNSTICKDFGDISTNNSFQLFKQTFTTKTPVGDLCLLIRKCYNGTVTIKHPILLEGDHTNNPNLPAYFEGIIGVGDKSKNLFNGKIIDGGWYNAHTGVFEKSQDNYLTQPIQVKQNTSYINNLSFNYCWLFDSSHNFIKYKGGGNVVNSESASYIVFGKSFSKVSKPFDVSKLQIEEGTVATPYEPYYEGKKIEILSRGKNLYKPNLQTKSAGGLAFSLHDNTLIVNGTATDTVDFRPVNEAKDIITLELYNYVNKLPVGTTLRLSNNLGLRNFFGISRNGAQTYIANTLTIQEGDYCITCFVRFEKGQSYNNAKLKIQLEINNVATEYAPYVEDKTQILLDEPLMKLPNGVCDEITKDGKLIRRIGKIILDGTERDLALNDTSSNHTQFVIHNIIKTAQKNNHANLVCNTKPTLVKNEGNNSIWIYIGKTVVFQMQSGMTVDAFRQWLSQNPTTVYYELETPVITDIVPPSVRIFKDGHLTFNTLVTPESTHLVQLNKSAQINNTLEQIQSLNKKVDALDIIYNSLISSTSNTLSNLNK